MHKLLGLLFITISVSSYGQETKPIDDEFYFIASECKAILVRMIDGKMISDEGDTGIVKCKKPKNLETECVFGDAKGKPYATRKLTAGILDGRLVAASKNSADVFTVSLMTRKYYSTTNIYIQDGALMGQKICTGDFMYDNDFKKEIKK